MMVCSLLVVLPNIVDKTMEVSNVTSSRTGRGGKDDRLDYTDRSDPTTAIKVE
jgi:hypothetical protein